MKAKFTSSTAYNWKNSFSKCNYIVNCRIAVCNAMHFKINAKYLLIWGAKKEENLSLLQTERKAFFLINWPLRLLIFTIFARFKLTGILKAREFWLRCQCFYFLSIWCHLKPMGIWIGRSYYHNRCGATSWRLAEKVWHQLANHLSRSLPTKHIQFLQQL